MWILYFNKHFWTSCCSLFHFAIVIALFARCSIISLPEVHNMLYHRCTCINIYLYIYWNRSVNSGHVASESFPLAGQRNLTKYQIRLAARPAINLAGRAASRIWHQSITVLWSLCYFYQFNFWDINRWYIFIRVDFISHISFITFTALIIVL